jgi:hypothetical protein
MMGLVLASGTAVFALLDWTAFGRDGEEIAVYSERMCQSKSMWVMVL